MQQANEELELKVQERTAELQQLNEQLKELNDLKSRVVSMVCHEFRNPLNNISLSVSYLDRYSEQLSAQQKMQYLEDIQANVERMAHMIDDILVIGKVEAKKIEVQPTMLNLVEFCQRLVAELRLTAPQHRIDLKTPGQSIWAQVDEQLLRSILTNILINSVRYSLAESKIQFKIFTQQKQIVFRIKDQGIGIPPEDIPHLFEPFHRGRNVSNIPGTGLGLSVVKKFVDLLQGKIEVNSQIGSGAIFVVCLPFI
ncbi:sensor histidine kinase [Leptothermofonsia sp. ETS-13]|uniref:sensor histidine kinase n=1 Tax=Leptothermofonsia sp. ETS-13 TaxID=3035696 RepID=UPI003B9E0CA5